jgi:hypothetical protein
MYPVDEQLPRHFTIEFRTEEGRLRLYRDGDAIGDPLTDNAYVEDGYRFHDVFHLAYAAVLAWSPVARGLLDCKRRSDEDVDRVDDGGRAGVTEEGISQLVYQYAKTRDMLRGATEVDQWILRTGARDLGRLRGLGQPLQERWGYRHGRPHQGLDLLRYAAGASPEAREGARAYRASRPREGGAPRRRAKIERTHAVS